MKYLLDTNVFVDFLHGDNKVIENLRQATLAECCISDITVYELYYGAYRSGNPDKSIEKIDRMIMSIAVLEATNYMKVAAKQKSQLAAEGNLIIEDFDIIIGSAAIANKLILVTDNTKHLGRLSGLVMENWKN